MSWAINQDCRDANGILSDIVAVSKQLVANGPPDNADGINGNVYTDALTGQQYQKQNGEWVLTVDLPAVSGGGGLSSTQAVGLPAYSEINRQVADVLEIQRVGAGSNIVTSSDFTNGLLIETTADPAFTTVNLADRVNFGNPIDGVTITRIGNNLQLYSGANLINMAGTQTIIDSTIRKQSPAFTVDLGTNAQAFNNIYSVNPLNVTSDQRWKADIEPFNMGLEFVNKLEPKSYRMADETEDGQTLHHKRRRCGLIAQDVHAAMISSGCDTSMCDILHNEKYDEDVPVGERLDKYMMSYSSLIPVLINAVKELSAKVQALEVHHA